MPRQLRQGTFEKPQVHPWGVFAAKMVDWDLACSLHIYVCKYIIFGIRPSCSQPFVNFGKVAQLYTKNGPEKYHQMLCLLLNLHIPLQNRAKSLSLNSHTAQILKYRLHVNLKGHIYYVSLDPQLLKSQLFESQGRKKNPNPNFLIRIFSGGVGVFHVEGWGPKSSVCPSKPRETKLFGGISRILPGYPRNARKV